MWNITVEEALRTVTAGVVPLAAEPVALSDARGRVLATDVAAPLDLPPFANSAMDGYAVVAASTRGAGPATPARLPVSARIAAGHAPLAPLLPGQAARIMTGAPLPPGADAVIKQEDTVTGDPATVDLLVEVAAGTNVRRPGEDLMQGATALAAGTVLGPAALGLLAGLGFRAAPCVRRPRVAILGTGDEVVPPGAPLGPGQVYDSNGAMLAALFVSLGAETTLAGAARDTVDDLRAAILRLIERGAEVVVTSGGVSGGDYDHVRAVVQAEGEVEFWQVRMRPGKPVTFGRARGVPWLGLPGTPVAAYVTALLFGGALVRALLGRPAESPQAEAVAGEAIRNGSGKRNYLRGAATHEGGTLTVRQAGGQLPTQLATLARSNCLIVAHEDVALYQPGDHVSILWLPGGTASGEDGE